MVCKKCEAASLILHTRSVDILTRPVETLESRRPRPVHFHVRKYQGRLEENRGKQTLDAARQLKE